MTMGRTNNSNARRTCTGTSLPFPTPETALQCRLRKYYQKQEGPGLCGIASATMAINAIHDKLHVKQQDVLRHIPKATRSGMNLAGIACLIKQYDCEADIYSVGVRELTQIKTFRDLLRRQRIDETVTIVNYWQPALGVDRQLGHFSPLGEYDDATDTVLLLDVGNSATPYHARYVALVHLWKGLMTIDGQGDNRGFVIVRCSRRKINH